MIVIAEEKGGCPLPANGDCLLFPESGIEFKKMKGRVMKCLTRIIGFSWVLWVLFTAEICRADDVFLASVGNNLAMSDVNNGSEAISNLDKTWTADTLRDQKESGVNYPSKRNAENNDYSYADVSGSPADTADRAGNSQRVKENSDSPSDSPFERYLLIVTVGVSFGLVLIAAGIAQWWRRRSIRRYWLFPMVQDDGEPVAPGASSPDPLIAKKQAETLPEEEINKHAQRRAA